MNCKLMVSSSAIIVSLRTDYGFRYQCRRYHQAQEQQHLHYCCESLELSLMVFEIADHLLQSLSACTSKRLLKIKGLSDTKVEKIKESAKKLSVSLPLHAVTFISDAEQPTTTGFITAAELREIRKRCIRISTGSKQLDAALNG